METNFRTLKKILTAPPIYKVWLRHWLPAITLWIGNVDTWYLQVVCGRSPGIRIDHHQHFYSLVGFGCYFVKATCVAMIAINLLCNQRLFCNHLKYSFCCNIVFQRLLCNQHAWRVIVARICNWTSNTLVNHKRSRILLFIMTYLDNQIN
jgi:hypothetical protein